MDKLLQDLAQSGRRIITDSKTPKQNKTKTQAIPVKAQEKMSGDAHEVFIKRCVKDKPPKKELVEEFKKFIDAAEKLL